MHLFEFKVDGLLHGSVVVVLCYTLVSARRSMKDWAKKKGLDPTTVIFSKSRLFEKPPIIFVADGDY